MSAQGKKLAIGVFCADWRLHQEGVHINNAVCKALGVDGVDVIAIPGPDKVCAVDDYVLERDQLVKWLDLLVDAHKSVAIAFVAHYNCAGHPVEDEQHDKDVEQMLHWYKETLDFPGEMVAYCATRKTDTDWPLKEIARIAASA